MSVPNKLAAGAPFPALSWNAVGGGKVAPSEMDGWRMLVVYRGAHCPLCKKYFKTLNELAATYGEAGIAVSAVSADPIEKAQADVEEHGWSFPVGYGMSVDDMRALGLYVSHPRSDKETDRPFAEPGVFVINPAGQLHIVDLSNAPFSRPDLASLLSGLQFILGNDYPIRGTHD